MNCESAVKDKIRLASEVISKVNQSAYKDLFLISNPVLSRDYFNNNYLKHFLNNKNLHSHPIHILMFKLASYYFKSLLHLCGYLVRFIEYFLSGLGFAPDKENRELLILIDTFFILSKIKESKNFKDLYFPGLEAVLKKFNKPFAYLPFFYSHFDNKRPFELCSVFKLLKDKNIPVICEFQLLSLYDILHLMYFILTYPFHVLIFSRQLKEDKLEIRLLEYELLDTIDQVTFYNFLRYLIGKKIVRLPYKKIKVISWFENQPIQKNLYKGLRTSGNKVEIYGAQLLLYSKNHLFIIPDENEENFGVLPDKIIVNGSYFMPEKSNLKYEIGPSLRYSKVFTTQINKEEQRDILVFLPYFKEEIESIIRIIKDGIAFSRQVFVKAHPATTIAKYRSIFPSNVNIVNKDSYKLFKEAKIIISNASGTLIEASSLGIPVIFVKNSSSLEYNNPLPEYGRGIIWEEATDCEELNNKIVEFEESLNYKAEEINAIASAYKQMFFCEPTEENIIKAFDLLSQ